ncbi:MAG: hypothetical protein IIV13_03500 [Bacteroidaceae bacterium]|nr:hypothetical protein [Bacteroidaceae bacterium]
MKILNNIRSLALLLPALALFSSCSEENADWTPAQTVNGPQVFFHNDNTSDISLTDANNTFTILVNRADATESAEYNLNIEAEEGVLSLFSIPSVAKFNAGESSVTLECTADVQTMTYDTKYIVTLSFDEKIATPYGSSSLALTIKRPAPWKSLGKATFVDGILTSIFSGVVEEPYEVEIQENELVPGFYRLVNPYTSSYPKEDWAFDAEKDYCLEIHAEDPDAVWFGETELGVNLGYGMISAVSIADFYVQGGNDPELVKELGYYGTLKDGEITFPVKGILYTMPQHPNGAGWYYANSDGMFSILLPGYTKGDYSASVDYAGIYTDKDGLVNAVANLSLGKDAQDVKAIVMSLDVDAAAVADAIAAGELEAMKVEAGRIEVPFNAEELGGNNFQIIVTVLADGAVKIVASTSFEYYGGGKNPWKSLGTGYYTDDILSSMWSLPTVTYEVEILEHTENAGMYRLVNPYNNQVYPAEYVDAFASQLGNSLAPAGCNLEVNAMDPEGVYISKQTLGLDFGDGEWAFETEGSRYLANVDMATLKKAGYMGAIVDGVIKFPAFKSDYGIYQGILYEGSGAYYAATNGAIEIILPGSNAFARNMATAKANTAKRNALKKSSGVKANIKLKKIFILQAEKFKASDF